MARCQLKTGQGIYFLVYINHLKMENKKINTCSQCSEEFETWDRYEDWGYGEIGSYEETEFCSEECYQEWRSDNRLELCN